MKRSYVTASPVKAGVTIMCAAALLTPVSDAIVKVLGETHQVPAMTIATVRFTLQTALMLPFMLVVGGAGAFRIKKPVLNLLRGSLLAIGSVSFFAALKLMALADAIAIFFAQPVFASLLSFVFLGEAPNVKRIFAVSLGFVGALFVIRPNLLEIGVVALLPLVCAICIAIYFLLGRYLSAGNSSVTMHFYTGLGALVTLVSFWPFATMTGVREFGFLLPSDGQIWLLLATMSFLASLVHLMYIQAYRRAPAGLLAPFNYLEIVSAVAIGIGVFGDLPDFWKTVGMGIIMSSGVLLVWTDREMKDTS